MLSQQQPPTAVHRICPAKLQERALWTGLGGDEAGPACAAHKRDGSTPRRRRQARTSKGTARVHRLEPAAECAGH